MEASRLVGVDRCLVGGRLVPGDVSVRAGRIAEVGLPAAGTGRLAAAGFVDLQVNGFAGVDFSSADVHGYVRAGNALAATGVTSFQPTFITLPWDAYPVALATAEEARRRIGGMVGVHLEGPFLSPRRCGAHDPGDMVEPSPERVRPLADLDIVTWITLAPELPGGLDAVAAFVNAGKRVAVGHSDATVDEARAAFGRGATAVTHLFNAQSGLHHRAPGVPGAALDDRRVILTVIVDSHHLAAEVVRLVFGTAPGRVALITDAIGAAATSDVVTRLGARTVTVADGVARLDDGTMAGSVVTMEQAVRNTADAGVPLEVALDAATRVPATALGLADRADLAPGSIADVVVLDDDLEVVRTLRDGAEIYAR